MNKLCTFPIFFILFQIKFQIIIIFGKTLGGGLQSTAAKIPPPPAPLMDLLWLRAIKYTDVKVYKVVKQILQIKRYVKLT